MVNFKKYLLYFIAIFFLLVCTVALSAAITIWIGFKIAAIIAFSIYTLLNYKLYNKIFGASSRSTARSCFLLKLPILLVAYILLATAFLPLGTPEQYTPDSNLGVTYELKTLTKGEEMMLYAFDTNTTKDNVILFVNGGPGGPVSESPLEFLSELNKRGYASYTYDHYSAGRSSLNNPDSSLQTIQDEVRRLDEIIDLISSGKKVDLIGSSYAGALISRYISSHSNKVRTFTAMDTSPIFTLEGNTKGSDLLNKEYQPLLNGEDVVGSDDQEYAELFRLKDWPHKNLRKILLLFVKQSNGNYAINSPVEASYLVERLFVEGDKFYGLSWSAQAINDDMLKQDDYYPALIAAQTPPVLVVHPEDGIVPWAIHKDYDSFYDNVTFLPWANAEHGVWEERPSELIDRLSEFWSGNVVLGEYTGIENPF